MWSSSEMLRDALPWDWNWPFCDTLLGKSWTDGLEYDAIRRQGASNMLEKLSIASSKVFAQVEARASRPTLPT